METHGFDTIKQLDKSHRPRILIVEDDISIEPIWDYILRKASPQARYDWCTNQLEATKLLDEEERIGRRYDLAVFDIFLAGPQTGFDLWKKYRRELEGRIILVSSIDYAKLNSYLGAGPDRPFYLRKPLVPHECIEAVHEILKLNNQGQE